MSERAPDGAQRFAGRASVYAASRPGYPPALAAWIDAKASRDGACVDLGAGTGRFTALLLATHHRRVEAIEPNAEMRAQLVAGHADAVASGRLGVHDGTAEQTGLADTSAVLVAAAQAAHWFDVAAAVREWRRILVPGGLALLVWNDWRTSSTPFSRDYGRLVRTFRGTGAGDLVPHPPAVALPPFLAEPVATASFANATTLDRSLLHQLAASASYLPGPGDVLAADLTQALDTLFDRHARNGAVTMDYRTFAYLGSPAVSGDQPPKSVV